MQRNLVINGRPSPYQSLPHYQRRLQGILGYWDRIPQTEYSLPYHALNDPDIQVQKQPEKYLFSLFQPNSFTLAMIYPERQWDVIDMNDLE